jgi:hypothetical protein
LFKIDGELMVAAIEREKLRVEKLVFTKVVFDLIKLRKENSPSRSDITLTPGLIKPLTEMNNSVIF